MGRLIRPREIARALIRVFARTLALTEKNGLVRVDVERQELPLDDQSAAIFHSV
jgi:hypothetical protein